MKKDSEPWLTWASADFAPASQFDAWESALNASHLPWALDRVHAERFGARMRLKDFGGLRVVSCECEPCSGRRRSRQIGRGEGEYFGALLLLSGEERVRQSGHALVLRPRSLMIWDSTKDIDFEVAADIKKVTVFIPRDRVASGSEAFLRHCDRVIDCGRGVPAVLASHLGALAGELGSIDHRTGTAAVDLTVDLIASALEASEAPGLSAGQGGLLSDIEAYVLDNLADPGLTPDGIARHFFISTRYLHLLFARSDRTVCRFIAEHRLDRARRELIRTAPSGEPITRIAADVGIDDPAHFSRLFKQRFGVSPRQLRKEAAGT